MPSKVRLLALLSQESAKKAVRNETRRVAVAEWEDSSAKLVVLEEASSEAKEELAVETVAKEESKVRALVEEELAAVPELFLGAVAINFLIHVLAEVEDDRPLVLVPLSLDRLLAVKMKDVIVVLCFKQNRLKNMSYVARAAVEFRRRK